MKKLIIVLIVVTVIVSFNNVVFGYETFQGTPTGYLMSKYYLNNGLPPKVLNIWVEGTPAANNLVTLYQWTQDSTQRWIIHSNNDIYGGISGTYRVESYANTNLALNYHQTTTKCTMYTYAPNTNPATDYSLNFEGANGGGYIIWLDYYGKYLWNSGSYNGAQCYWHSPDGNGVSTEDIWELSA